MAYLKNTIIEGELKVGAKSTLSDVQVQGNTTIASDKVISFNSDNAATVIESNKITSTNFIGDLDGNATTATNLQTARTISLSGGATGTATSFDGSSNISIPVTSLNASKLTGTASVNTTGNAATASQLGVNGNCYVKAENNNEFNIYPVKDASTTERRVFINHNQDAGNIILICNGSGTDNTGQGTVIAGTFIATSDKRLKENITPFKVEKSILDLPVYKYNFISDGNKKIHVGCLAQDLQEICPEIVNEGQDGYLAIEESKIVYLLLDEVKQLRKEIDELRVNK